MALRDVNYPDTGGTSLLTVTLHSPRPSTEVCTAVGEIDIATAPDFQQQLRAALSRAPHYLLIDLTQVTFFGAAGVSCLHDLASTCTDGSKLALIGGGSSPAAKVLRLCPPHEKLPCFDDLPHALRFS